MRLFRYPTFKHTHTMFTIDLKKEKNNQQAAMHHSISRMCVYVYTEHTFTHTHTHVATNGIFFEIHFTFDNNNIQLLRLLWKFSVCGAFFFVVGWRPHLIVSILKLRDIFYFIKLYNCILSRKRKIGAYRTF